MFCTTSKNSQFIQPEKKYEIFCPNCLMIYQNSDKGGPEELSCDHSYCYNCVLSVQLGNFKCKTCDEEENLKEEKEVIENKLFSITEALSNVAASLEEAESYVSHIENRQDGSLLEVELKDDLEDTVASFHAVKSKIDLTEMKIYGYSRDFIDIENTDCDLNLLKQMIKRKRLLYAASCIGGQIKYGPVKVQDNLIRISSLSVEKRESESTYFWLHEFKARFEDKLCSFFTFPCPQRKDLDGTYTIMLDIIDSQRHSGFVEICTGEAETSFKNASYTSTGENSYKIHLELLNYMETNRGKDNVQLDDNDVIFRFLTCQTWELKRVVHLNNSSKLPLRSIVAKRALNVHFPMLYLPDPKERKIIECGIAVYIDDDNE